MIRTTPKRSDELVPDEVPVGDVFYTSDGYAVTRYGVCWGLKALARTPLTTVEEDAI